MDNTRRIYLDNIRWITVVIVVIYHIIYMFNGVQPFGVIGPFKKHQLQDAFQYVVYPWFMALLFVVSGMSARYYLEKHDTKTFVREKTRKLLVPSTIGLLVFQWILGYYNMKISGALDQLSAMPKPVLYGLFALSGTGVLWYIQMLWLFSMLLLLVHRIDRSDMESGGKGACLDACIDGYFDIWCSTDFEYTGSHRLQIWNLWFLLFSSDILSFLTMW